MKSQRNNQQKVVLSALGTLHVMESMNQFAAATELHRSARREERQGNPLTAAVQWRKAAGLFTEEFLSESCWREWERIMKLPRSLARAI